MAFDVLDTSHQSMVSLVFLMNVLMSVSRLVNEREEKRKDTAPGIWLDMVLVNQMTWNLRAK